jgi:hypothetical protein
MVAPIRADPPRALAVTKTGRVQRLMGVPLNPRYGARISDTVMFSAPNFARTR